MIRGVSTGNYSSIGHCLLDTPTTIKHRDEKAVISPEFDYESHGVEDPRIVKIDDLFYLTYTAFDGTNAMGALAVSKDLMQFEKLGLVVPLIPYDYFNHLVSTKVLVNEKYIRFNQQNQSVDDKGRKRG